MKLTKKNSFKLKNQIKHIFVKSKKYYAQCGEDLIIYNYLCTLHMKRDIFYLDLGAGDPMMHSNTYFFYIRGSFGVCVDANKNLCNRYRRKRKRDTIMNYAVSLGDDENCKFYNFDMNTVSTTDKSNIDYLLENGFKIKKIQDVPCIKVEKILEDASNIKKIDLLSIDIEGDEFGIIKAIDFDKYKIDVICVEVVDFNTGLNLPIAKDIILYMKNNGYELLANTGINLIFNRN